MRFFGCQECHPLTDLRIRRGTIERYIGAYVLYYKGEHPLYGCVSATSTCDSSSESRARKLTSGGFVVKKPGKRQVQQEDRQQQDADITNPEYAAELGERAETV